VTQPRVTLQGPSVSAADREGCSCSLEVEHGSTGRRVRPRLRHGRPGREQPAPDVHPAALVGLFAPGRFLDMREAGLATCVWRLCCCGQGGCRRACFTGAYSNSVRGHCRCAGAGCGCVTKSMQEHHPRQRQRPGVRGRRGAGPSAGAWRLCRCARAGRCGAVQAVLGRQAKSGQRAGVRGHRGAGRAAGARHDRRRAPGGRCSAAERVR